MTSIIQWFQSKLKKHNSTDQKKIMNTEAEKFSQQYFRVASSWADDIYTISLISRNRWRALSVWVLLPLVFSLLSLVMFLVPTQHLVPLIIHHYENGAAAVEVANMKKIQHDQGQIESDIVRYVVNRESFSEFGYPEQFSLVNLLSDSSVARQYLREQNASNPLSPVHQCGSRCYRSVHVLSVILRDSQEEKMTSRHQNLAQVDFTVSEHDKTTGQVTSKSYTAIVSWQYRNMPKNPDEAWRNWSGFCVTHYQRELRHTSQSHGD